jgi:hypothetical protein
MHALLERGSVDEAFALSHDMLRLAADCDLLWQVADALAWLAACRGDLPTAAELAGWSDAAWRRRDAPRATLPALRRDRVQQLIGSLPAAALDLSTSAGARLNEADIVTLWEGTRTA